MARLFYGTNRARESYFWEARRLTGETRLEPRAAFVRAISGQVAFQVERAALSHAALPEDFEGELDRQVAVHGAARFEPSGATRVRLAPGLEVREQAVLGDGCFEMGQVIAGNGRDDLPVSALVANLAKHATGRRLDEIADRIAGGDGSSSEAVAAAAALPIAEQVLEVAP